MQDLNQEQKKWDQLSQKLLDISHEINLAVTQKRKPCSKVNLIEGYTLVYSNCVQKPSKAEKMFTIFKQLLINHLVLSIRVLQDIQGNKIKQFNGICLSYFSYAGIVCKKVFAYLDRYYLPSRDVGNLNEVAMGLFNQKIIVMPHSKQILTQYFVHTIGEYRKNLILTQNELHRFADNLCKLNLQFYIELKKIFVEQSINFYKAKFQESKQLVPLQFYCKMHNLSIFQEVLASKCFVWSPRIHDQRRELSIIFTKELIEPYTDTFLVHPQGLLWALRFKKFNLLNQVIEIYTRYEGLTKIKEKYYEYVSNQSRELIKILQTPAKTQSQIATLIYDFLTNHNTILIQGFKKNQEMQVTLSNAIESVLGKWQKYSQNLFLYCKSVVSKGEFKTKSYLIKQIFQKMVNKDEFIHKCEIWLEDIIFNEKVNLNVYKEFMAFLHELCGAQNTLKLEKILSDYTEENQVKYSSFIDSKILSFHLWQKRFKDQLAIDLNIPSPLVQIWKLLEQNYVLTHSKKRLTLLPLSSNVLLVFKNKTVSFNVKCNLLQSSIIMTLSFKRKTLDELQQELNIEKHRIEGFIQSTKFIKQRNEFYCLEWEENMTEDCDFTIQSENNSKFNKAIEQDRTILLEAGIVRVVKRKKEVSFQEIFDFLSGCIKLFKPQPAMVKATIQKLVKRDFIEQNEQGLYLYKE